MVRYGGEKLMSRERSQLLPIEELPQKICFGFFKSVSFFEIVFSGSSSIVLRE